MFSFDEIDMNALVNPELQCTTASKMNLSLTHHDYSLTLLQKKSILILFLQIFKK